MSDSLKIDLSELNALFLDLMAVSDAFGSIGNFDRQLADAVGNDELKRRVMEFGEGWDDRRAKIVDSLDTIWKAVHSIELTFVSVDQKLAGALTAREGQP